MHALLEDLHRAADDRRGGITSIATRNWLSTRRGPPYIATDLLKTWGWDVVEGVSRPASSPRSPSGPAARRSRSVPTPTPCQSAKAGERSQRAPSTA